MKFSITEHGGVTVIAIEGNLMGGPDATTLHDKLVELIDTNRTRVVLDLRGVSIINSSGLGMLIKGASTLKEAGGALTLAGASDKILELIRITKLTGVLQTFPDVAEAMASFRK